MDQSLIVRPDDNIDPSKKQNEPEFCRDWAKYIYNYGSAGYYQSPYSMGDKFTNLREYAEGLQTVSKYKKWFSQIDSDTVSLFSASETDDTEKKRRGLMNVNWAQVSILPKMLTTIIAKLHEIDYDVTATAVDKQSNEKRNEKLNEIKTEMEIGGDLDEMYNMIGVQRNKPEYVPNDNNELELYKSLGGLKLDIERALELICKDSFEQSRWDFEIKDKLYEDALTLNHFFTIDYFDENSQQVLAKYSDPRRVIIQYSIHQDYRNSEFWGYKEFYTVGELRSKGVPQSAIDKVILKAGGAYGNPSQAYIYQNNVEGSRHNVNSVKIPVLEGEFLTLDSFYDTKRKTSIDTERVKPEPFKKGKKRNEETYQNREDRETIKTPVLNKYKFSWLIGSDFVFDYGISNLTNRKKHKDPCLSIHGWRGLGQSIVEKSIPFVDQFHLDWYILQNCKANAAPSGIAIDIDFISNLNFGGKENWKPLEVLKLRLRKGDLIYKSTGVGIPQQQGDNRGKPFQELAGGIGPYAQELMNDMAYQIQMMQSITGLTAPAEGTNIDPNAPVRSNEMELMATNNMLKYFINGYFYVKSETATNIGLKTQILLRGDKELFETYSNRIGVDKLNDLIATELSAAELGIYLKPKPTDLMKKVIYEQIQTAMAVGRDGVAILKPSMGVMLVTMLEEGNNLKDISSLLALFEEKELARVQENQQANAQQQAQIAQQSNEQKFQQEMQIIKFKTDEQIRLETAKAQIMANISNPANLVYEAQSKGIEMAGNQMINENNIKRP